MKPIKQIFNDMLAWWEESLEDEKFRKVLKWLVIGVVIFGVILALAFPSSAAEEPSDPFYPAIPADLTGYTIRVPAGWTATAGYGLYHLNGSITTDSGELDLVTVTTEPHNFGIGYENDGSIYQPYADYIGAHTNSHVGGGSNLFGGVSFYFHVTGGNDVSSSSLIQWFVDNNATFTNNNTPEPNPLVTFKKGLYEVSDTWYNSTITTQLDGMQFYSLNEGDLYEALTVQNNELVFDDENLNTYIMARKGTTAVTWLDNSGQFVYFLNDEQIPQSLAQQIPSLLEYIPDVTLTDFQRMQDSWYLGVQDGFLASKDSYDTGFEAGFDAGVENSGGNFFGNFVEGILNALDKLTILPGGISILDLIKAIGGIFVVIWLLKLLAGG